MASIPEAATQTAATAPAGPGDALGAGQWRGLRTLLVAVPCCFVAGNAVLTMWLGMKPYLGFEYIGHFYNFNTIAVPIVAGVAGLAGLASWRRLAERRSLRRATLACLAAALALPALRAYATHVEPHRLQLRHASLASAKIARPLRILHISDIQSAAVGPYEQAAFATMRQLKPDLIVFTGDLLQPLAPATRASELPKMEELLDSLAAPLGKFAVLGDVDNADLIPAYERCGFRLLDGAAASVQAGGFVIDLLGVTLDESRNRDSARPRIERFLAAAPPGRLRLVLGHGPDYVLAVPDLPIDLCLAGHTHGGQIRIPFLGPILTLSRVPRAWARGLHRAGATWLHVSAGIGCEHIAGLPNIRFACPPEMTLLELTPTPAGAP